MPAHNRDHYRGTYDRRAKVVRHYANTNPDTKCWRCGERARIGDPWQAGHLIDGDPHSPLAPEHRSCNAAAGARILCGLINKPLGDTSYQW